MTKPTIENPESGKLPEPPEAVKTVSEAPAMIDEGSLVSDLPQASGESLDDTIPEPEQKRRGRPPGSKSGSTRSHKANPSKARNRANAETVVSTLDMMKKAVSNGECPPAETEARKQVLEIWARYFEETGLEPPLWVSLVFASGAYVAPAFTTEPAKSKLGSLVDKFGAWRLNRRASKKA